MMSLSQVAGDICELFRLCSTKQLEAAKDFISRIDKSAKKKEQSCHGDKCDGHKDEKSTVTMAMERLSVGDNTLTINDQCSDGHHGNSEHDTLEMEDDRTDTILTDTIATEDDGWEVVKRKKR